MRVLQVSYRSEVAGGERVLLQLCDALQAAGHEVACVLPTHGPLEEELRSRGLEAFLVPMSKTYDLRAAWRIRSLLREQQIDVLHTHGMLVNILGRFAVRGLTEVGSVSTVHMARDLLGPPRFGGWLQKVKNRLYYAPLDNWTSRWNDKVVAVSRAVREDLVIQGCPEERIRVILNGIDLDCFRSSHQDRVGIRAELGIGEDVFLVACIARLSPGKDLPCFIEALCQLRAFRPRAQAFIAGDGPALKELQGLLRSRKLERVVHLLGYRRDVPALLAACDVVVLSSISEGLPLVPLEAMAASRPVVATRVPGTMEAVVHEETGLLVKIGDHQALGNALQRLAENQDLARRLGEAGCRRAEEEFSLERTTGAYLKLYAQVCPQAT
jgi:glycosyltransferase involved in cell wall biosynthesis